MRLRWRPLEVVEISGLNAEGAGQVKFMGWSPTTKPSGS
jgi:hypothetical protein